MALDITERHGNWQSLSGRIRHQREIGIRDRHHRIAGILGQICPL
ncbi:MAG: hypothetical protein ACOC9Y_02535 [Chloroflexota bacterium]